QRPPGDGRRRKGAGDRERDPTRQRAVFRQAPRPGDAGHPGRSGADGGRVPETVRGGRIPTDRDRPDEGRGRRDRGQACLTARPDTLDAHQVIGLAADQGVRDTAVAALFRAYLTEGRDISKWQTLTDVVVEAGLDRQQAEGLLEGADGLEATNV